MVIGRLGYACLNTVLRGTKPDSIFCSRTCRIASIEEEGLDLPKGLALMNVRDLSVMIEVSRSTQEDKYDGPPAYPYSGTNRTSML